MADKLNPEITSIHSVSSEATTIVSDQHPDIDLPIQFKIYCDKNRFSKSIWYLGPKKGTRLKIVSCHNRWRDAILEFHDGVELEDPVLASSVIKGNTIATDIDIQLPNGRYNLTTDAKHGGSRMNVDFRLDFPTKTGTERFIWHRSDGSDVKSLGGRGGGWVLVRESTGEGLAAYQVDLGHPKLSGRFKFMDAGASGAYGKDWAVMVIMSALTIGQRKRDLNNFVVASAA